MGKNGPSTGSGTSFRLAAGRYAAGAGTALRLAQELSGRKELGGAVQTLKQVQGDGLRSGDGLRLGWGKRSLAPTVRARRRRVAVRQWRREPEP